MFIDEGGAAKHGLGDYIARQLANREQLKSAAELEKMNRFLEATDPLKRHLLRLVAPFSLLLHHFQVKHLMEEAAVVLGCNETKIRKLEPLIFQDIVSNPDPKLFDSMKEPRYFIKPEAAHYSLSDLLYPEDFRSKINSMANLLEYGFALERPCEVWTEVKQSVLRGGFDRDSVTWLGPGGGDKITPGAGHYTYWDTHVGKGITNGIRSITLTVDPITHGLIFAVTDTCQEYSYRQGQDMLIRYKGVSSYVYVPKIIQADQSPEILKKMLGDYIIDEQDSKTHRITEGGLYLHR